MVVPLFQVILIAERGEAELGFAAIDSLTFKDLSEEPCETFPPQVTNHHQQNKTNKQTSDSLTFKDLSEEPCETLPPQVT